jgi:diacylglycerol O-acyltransferase
LTERETMSVVDAAWLRMDQPTNPMTITAVLRLAERLGRAELEALLRERLLAHDRFRQRAASSRVPFGPPSWELDETFALEAHVHHVGLPAPGDDEQLAALVGDLMSAPLERARPLWSVHVVDGPGAGSTLVARIHHAMGDGVALVRLLLGLTDEGAGLPPIEVGLSPSRPAHVLDAVRDAAAQAATLGRLLLLPSDPRTALKEPLGVVKRAAWSRAYGLGDLKAASRARGVTVNDLVTAAVAGAVRAHLLARGGWPEGREVRALVPVFLRSESAGQSLGNHFGLVFLALPIEASSPDERLRLVHERMRALKSSPDAMVALGVLGAMGVASRELEELGVDLFTRKASLLVTNVPGPPMPIHLAGKRLDDLLVWAPVSGHVGLGVSILSYAGRVRVGVACDAHVLQAPSELLGALERELELLT